MPPQRQGQHLGLEEEQDISRVVIAAREKPRRLFPRTQGFLRCSCKENEMVDKKQKKNEHETHLKKPQLDLLHLMKQKLSLALMSVTGIIFSWRLMYKGRW